MTTAFTKDQLIEHAKRRLNYSRCGCRISDSDRALDEALIETAIATLECLAATATPAVQAEQEPVGIVRYVDIGLPDTKGIHATFYTQLPEGTELFSRPAQAEQTKRLIGWRTADYTEETSDPEMAKNWAAVVGVLPVFEGDINTRLQAEQLSGNTEQVSQPYTLPEGYALVPVEPTIAMLDEFDSIIDYGADDSNDAWRRLLAAAWIKSLPAAPQQEKE